MADIKAFLAKIKEAVFGEEVRGSIYDALRVINEESEAAKISAAESAGSAAEVLNNTEAVVEAAQTAAAAANEAAEAAMDYVLGDISEKTVTFETAAQRAGIESGDSLSVAFGKLAKFCADLDQHAFNPLANNLTTNTAGYGMDARQGPVIDKKISDVQTSVDELNTKMIGEGQKAYITFSEYGDYWWVSSPIPCQHADERTVSLSGNVKNSTSSINATISGNLFRIHKRKNAFYLLTNDQNTAGYILQTLHPGVVWEVTYNVS